MRQYLDLLQDVLLDGTLTDDRTGVGTVSKFGTTLRFDLRDGFPLVTTKRMYWKGIVQELLWFLSGSQNIKQMQDAGVHIWDSWADEQGHVGPLYGYQWRNWGGEGIDQLQNAIEKLKTDPTDRRILVSAWNVSDIPKMALPPCHMLYQFYLKNNKLSILVYQRSADMFLGVPFDIASYALLLSLVAAMIGAKPKELIYHFGDTHIYTNHFKQVLTQLKRDPYPLPLLAVNKSLTEINNINDITVDDFKLEFYEFHNALSAPVAV